MTEVDMLLGPLARIFDEITRGATADQGWMLNPGDPGLLASLDRLTAAQASAPPPNGGASIAAHVDHMRYGLGLLNRWQRGEEPFADADWAPSWTRTTVSDGEWSARRAELRREIDDWRGAMASPRDTSEFSMNGIVAVVGHLAYHFGAIRQIDRTIRGPAATPGT